MSKEQKIEIPELVPLTDTHIKVLESALGSYGRDIGAAIKFAYNAYATLAEAYVEVIKKHVEIVQNRQEDIMVPEDIKGNESE